MVGVGMSMEAITAYPKNVTLRSHRALLYVELGDYQKAVVAYEQVHQLCPENIDAIKTTAKFYQRCRQKEFSDRSIRILEDYLKSQPNEVSVVDLLAALLMETKDHDQALQHFIEHAQVVESGKDLPLNLKIKVGICHVHLGNIERGGSVFNVLQIAWMKLWSFELLFVCMRKKVGHTDLVGNNPAIQEIMILPTGASRFEEALQMGFETCHYLKMAEFDHKAGYRHIDCAMVYDNEKEPRSCSRAMKAVGVVETTCEEIFELVMSMDGTRFE
ncbi:hypothetical protein RIF29_09605 [Crotalaria pallida]|uniref:phosphopyruvate hydratase n=1 Tax=Crotalaria pallida TaxID=3830 RepID=A0AAN9IJI7_CROPI